MRTGVKTATGLGGGDQGRKEGWVEEVQVGPKEKEPNEENVEPNQNTKTCVEQNDGRARRECRMEDGVMERQRETEREEENEFQRVGCEQKITDETSVSGEER